jgi:hypothetical protein
MVKPELHSLNLGRANHFKFEKSTDFAKDLNCAFDPFPLTIYPCCNITVGICARQASAAGSAAAEGLPATTEPPRELRFWSS